MEAAYVKENMDFLWKCENGLVENMQFIIREFKLARQLIVSFFHYVTLIVKTNIFKK